MSFLRFYLPIKANCIASVFEMSLKILTMIIIIRFKGTNFASGFIFISFEMRKIWKMDGHFKNKRSLLDWILFFSLCFCLLEREEPSKSDIISLTTVQVSSVVGFSSQLSIDFLHDHSFHPKRCLPVANTCIKCLKLPPLDTSENFSGYMDSATDNKGFRRE